MESGWDPRASWFRAMVTIKTSHALDTHPSSQNTEITHVLETLALRASHDFCSRARVVSGIGGARALFRRLRTGHEIQGSPGLASADAVHGGGPHRASRCLIRFVDRLPRFSFDRRQSSFCHGCAGSWFLPALLILPPLTA